MGSKKEKAFPKFEEGLPLSAAYAGGEILQGKNDKLEFVCLLKKD